jgi:hypothetical protein
VCKADRCGQQAEAQPEQRYGKIFHVAGLLIIRMKSLLQARLAEDIPDGSP